MDGETLNNKQLKNEQPTPYPLSSHIPQRHSRIENNAKGYSFSPSGSGTENLETAQAMLAFLPGVTVSEDNMVKLLDKNPVIYVNGIRLTSQDELAAIAPDRVEKVEGTGSPSARGRRRKAAPYA